MAEIKASTLAGYRYRPFEIAQACENAGWEGFHHLIDAVSVVLGESGGYSEATHNNDDGSIDRGPWQINSVHVDSGQISEADCFDLKASTAFARKLYVRTDAYDFTPWVAYTNGSYKAHFQDASRGVVNAFRNKHNLPFLTEK